MRNYLNAVARGHPKTISGILLFICFLFMFAAGAPAQTSGTESDISDNAWTTAGLRLGYLGFSNESMEAGYDYLMVSTFQGTIWTRRGVGFGAELGWASAEGQPQQMESTWNLSDSWIKVQVLNVGLNFLYAFMNPSPSSTFMPYVGLCPALWIGSERIAADASRQRIGLDEAFRTNLLATGFAYGGHAVLGSSIAVGRGARVLFEARWTQSWGDLFDLSEEEEKEGFESTLYQTVMRTDFNFTGWRIDVGVEW